MSTECFVPKCKNTVGVLFPKDPILKKKWLKALEIKNLNPNPSSFICLDHFEESVANKGYASKGSPKKRKASPSKKNNKLKNASSNKSDTENDEESESTVPEEITQSETKEGEDEGTDNAIINDSNEKAKSNESFDDDLSICRLCTSETDDSLNIYEKFDPKMPKMTIADAILSCLRPLKIKRDDRLPKQICKKCLGKLKEYYQFWFVSIGMDEKQRELLEIEDPEGFTFTDSSGDDMADLNWSNSPTPDGLEKLPETEPETDTNPAKDEAKTTNEISEVQADADKKAEIDKKFDMVEEQLRMVLEGEFLDEEDTSTVTEKIIIDVVNDEEFENNKNDNVTELPVTVKPVTNNSPKNAVKRKLEPSKPTIVNPTRIKTGENTELVLPKGIHVKIREKFVSDTGTFFGSNISYLYGSKFFMANDYLYEYRLQKGNKRNLTCIVTSCPGLGIQKKNENGKFTNQITIADTHNHPPLDAKEQKKYMFYAIMKHQMHINKNLNFKNVYESICNMDPQIRELIPIRTVINEICRHQLGAKLPVIKSFDEFYDLIENNLFNRLHFTYAGKQFFQEKFATSDGAKAILFANAESIKRVSKSKLMYVDASFIIDNTDDFAYQLVTVLVWADDSYYPIVFALVNRKTQEIYKQMFKFLYETLAPNLRPDDIVTDYEANLYYALGETYVESNIGGSVFYYTQNLYKKACSLKLSRELETNSLFRNVYHMLLMLPLLPVNTILDGLANIEVQARELGVESLTNELFEHVYEYWINIVTPELFCVHRLENRINENIIAPFKKFRDYIMLQKGKSQKKQSIVHIVEKLIELEAFLVTNYFNPQKKWFSRDLSSAQKKNVLRAWQYIESNPKININSFFSKVLGYIKCMENQLWIWGFYRFEGELNDDLINANNFSIYNGEEEEEVQYTYVEEEEEDNPEFVSFEPEREEEAAANGFENGENEHDDTENDHENGENEALVMEAVIDENGRFVLQNSHRSGNGTLKQGLFKYNSVK